uniref:Secreted protein n=1 Tax=Heterorhabditis bacteriophora TaxID=37862 RepID=A0A1I7WZ05_HETBA
MSTIVVKNAKIFCIYCLCPSIVCNDLYPSVYANGFRPVLHRTARPTTAVVARPVTGARYAIMQKNSQQATQNAQNRVSSIY